jgi:dTDP-4-dehydrorhamnose reductase
VSNGIGGPAGGGGGRRMLVTGGSGFLGGVVVDVARAAGWGVTASGFTAAGGGLVPLDVRDRDAVDALVASVRPHAVVHTAYVKDRPEARAVIVEGSANVARAASACGARLVHLSTDIVFSGAAGRPYTEDDPPAPVMAYGRDKADAEARVAEAAPGAVIVRTSLIYGGPARPDAPPDRMARDPGVAHFIDELRSPILVDDLAAALVELCDPRLDVFGPLHVGGADGVSRWELACLLAGPDRAVRQATAPPGRPLDCRLDSSRARALLRTRLRGVREVVGARAADRP